MGFFGGGGGEAFLRCRWCSKHVVGRDTFECSCMWFRDYCHGAGERLVVQRVVTYCQLIVIVL